MHFVETKKFKKLAQDSSNKEKEQFIHNVRRKVQNVFVNKDRSTYKHVSILSKDYDNVSLGLGLPDGGKIYKWTNLEPFFVNKDIDGAADQVLQDAYALVSNPEYTENAEAIHNSILKDVDKYYKNNPRGNWSGD